MAISSTLPKLAASLALWAAAGSAQEIIALREYAGDTAFNQALIAGAKGAKPSQNGVAPRVAVEVGDTIIPHVVDGGSWRTTFMFVNLENYPVRFKVIFLSDNARDLYLPIAGLGITSGVQITLPPTGTITFESAGAPSLSSGWAYMLPDSPVDAIGGLAIFRQSIPGRPDFEAVVPIVSKFDRHFALLFDNVGFTTAAALSNTTLDSLSVPVVVRSETGVVLQRETIFLPALSHTAFAVPDRLATTAGRRGSIEFLSSGPGIGALGLRFGSASFTSFQVLSNPAWQ